ncbi:MAG: hypothetical protein MJ001_08060 [Paludibacteraceae bacterium]|nr:hypothetical protein [Paludibacteraceae bacterium]
MKKDKKRKGVLACEQLAAQANAQFEESAFAPSPTHNMERLPCRKRGECHVTF